MQHPYSYTVHSLTIASELELPELTPLEDDPGATPDVRVRIGELSPDLQALEPDIPDFVSTASGHLLVVPDAARFVVRQDNEVIIEIVDNADLALLRLYLFGSVMGLICHQRGLLPY
jgi:hypothetical protein